MDRIELDDIIRRLLDVKNGRIGMQVQLAEMEIRKLCFSARGIFMEQPCLLELESPVNICGDIHGHYSNLLQVFEIGGYPPASNYLFLGNYIDYGKHNVETICLLLAYKIKYPANFFLLRGNHECTYMSRIYGFYDECRRRFNVRIWKTFIDCFNCLPIAAIVDDKILCVHGGLSPDLINMDQIKNIIRPTDVPDSGLLCDLLWADPDLGIKGWGMNDRGISYTFGADIVSEFLLKFEIDLFCRGHQVVEDGYEFFGERQLVTVFSAPNFRGEFDNAGAMMIVDESLMCSFHILKPAQKKFNLFNKISGPGIPPNEDVLGSRTTLPDENEPRTCTPANENVLGSETAPTPAISSDDNVARATTSPSDAPNFNNDDEASASSETSVDDAILCSFQIQIQIRNPLAKKKGKVRFGNSSDQKLGPLRKEQKQ